MMRAESVAFLPVVFENCWIGMIDFSSSRSDQRALAEVVKSPYMRR